MSYLDRLSLVASARFPVLGHPKVASTARRFSTFASIGLVAAIIYAVVIYIAVKLVGLPIFVGSCLAFGAGIPISYIGNRRLTYKSRNAVPMELRRFFLAQFANLFITSAVVSLASRVFSLPLYAATLLSYVVAPSVTWLLFEVWVYKQKSSED